MQVFRNILTNMKWENFDSAFIIACFCVNVRFEFPFVHTSVLCMKTCVLSKLVEAGVS